jgi:hypothetical protein
MRRAELLAGNTCTLAVRIQMCMREAELPTENMCTLTVRIQICMRETELRMGIREHSQLMNTAHYCISHTK